MLASSLTLGINGPYTTGACSGVKAKSRVLFDVHTLTPRIRTLIATSRKIVTNYFIMEVNGRMGTIFCQKFL